MGQPLWTPSPDQVAATNLDAFRREHYPHCADSDALWAATVADPGLFWRRIWDLGQFDGNPGDRLVEVGDAFWQHRFLPDATFNAARHLIERPEVADSDRAIIWVREDGEERVLTRADLRRDVAAFEAYLRSVGVVAGDRVAAWMPHVPETVVAFLAAAAIGAVFTSTSADFGTDGVVDRFGQTEPTVLVVADGYRYGGRAFSCLDRLPEIVSRLPSVRSTVVVCHLDPDLPSPDLANVVRWNDAVAAHRGAVIEYAELPGDHPLYILYSSGTTGKPKCIVHRSLGVMLKHAAEQILSSDIKQGDQVFYFTTCGWMMWNWLTSALGVGAGIVLYEGNPSHPNPAVLFGVAERHGVTLMGVSAKFIDAAMKSGLRPVDLFDLGSLRTVCSTGSPLSHEGFAWVYGAVKSSLHLASISGGTDLCGCLVNGDPTKAVHAGAIQQKALGLDIAVFDDAAKRVDVGVKGELVCVNPFPSMPLCFWGDDDGSRYRSAYFERFPGVWAHGDYASWTEEGGMVIHGRSDATLNASGVRIGTAEIYRVVEQLPQVAEAICIGQEWENDTRIVLFVRLIEGATLTDDLQATIRRELRSKCSPRHVPAVIRAVADIPRTRSGKIVELAVTDVVHGRPVKNLEALANPEALDLFAFSDR